MSRLNDLLRQLEAKDPALAKELRTEYDALADRRAFGLNFERHTPESVELPGRPVRKGDKVHVLPDRGENPTQENSRVWRVTSIDRSAGSATLESLDTAGGSEQREATEISLVDLVVVAEFRDPIYPGLVSTGRIERGNDKPFHAVINAENYHALQTLLFTHRGKVDCIYIDPPYNTGGEWIYNDKYVAPDDHYRHSKWLAFLERRLLLARELLKPTGVIIIAIGEHEHHRLRMLLDQTFGAGAFLANVVWQGRVKGSANFTAGGVDYMLMYARDAQRLSESGVIWREAKDGVEEALAKAAQIWDRFNPDWAAATKAMKAWMGQQDFDAGVARYKFIDENGRLHRDGVSIAAPDDPKGRRPRYDVLHPVTGKPCKTPSLGWRWTEERMREEIAAGNILFGPDENTIPALKKYFDESVERVPPATFVADRFKASAHVKNIFGDSRFPFPKNHEVLMRWIGLACPSDGIVLDFFGGSGSTCEAVMRLNSTDGGSRQCLLITNNELSADDAKLLRAAGRRRGDAEWEGRGVYEYVTKPRIATVVTGTRLDGSTFSEGLDQNVEFFDLTYEAALRVSSNREFRRVAPLLWMKSGCKGRRINDVAFGWAIADSYAVLADLDQTEAFLEALAQHESDGTTIGLVFVVTDEDRLFASVCRALPANVEAVRLYEAYLRNFEIEAGRATR